MNTLATVHDAMGQSAVPNNDAEDTATGEEAAPGPDIPQLHVTSRENLTTGWRREAVR